MKNRSPFTNHRSQGTLSVVLATRDEEENIGKCLESVKDIAHEIIIFDEHSTDQTAKIAESFGAKVFKYKHKNNFHETKQRAIEKANGEWVLQLDADERVSENLKKEILAVVSGGQSVASKDESKKKLFQKYQRLIDNRDGKVGTDEGEVVAYFIPRLNLFIGKPLKYAGVYPDGVIRLFRNGKGRLPAKSVHELPEIDGKVGWLYSDLVHDESPTLNRYITRNNRYTTLIASDLARDGVKKNGFTLLKYVTWKPAIEFSKLYLRHKGYKDGMRGFLWSLFSAWRFPIAYFKYWTGEYKTT